MRSYLSRVAICAALSALDSALAIATEPNETFQSATVVPSGEFLISDSLGSSRGSFPDTLLGIRDFINRIYLDDDNGSPVGDGRASGLRNVQTNSGSINFSVTGVSDLDFSGAHEEAGDFKVFVNVYDLFDDLVDSFTETQTLAPGIVQDFDFADAEWLGGSYDVYIDNTVGTAAADVDFYTFTGLAPGSRFVAQTVDPSNSGIDTYMGWFDANGSLLTSNDDQTESFLSVIEGAVPAEGKLTFGVTGTLDEEFVGMHFEEGPYQLKLDMNLAGVDGDFNQNHAVDAADYVVWRKNLGPGDLPNDGGASPGFVDEADYSVWRANFGAMAANLRSNNSATVPEPPGHALAVLVSYLVVHFHALVRGHADRRKALRQPTNPAVLYGSRAT